MRNEQISSCSTNLHAILENHEQAKRLHTFGQAIPDTERTGSVWEALDAVPRTERFHRNPYYLQEFATAVRKEGRGTLVKMKRALGLVHSVVAPEDESPYSFYVGSLDEKFPSVHQPSMRREFNWLYPTLESIRNAEFEQLASQIGDFNADLLATTLGVQSTLEELGNYRPPNRKIFVFAAYPVAEIDY